MNNLITNIKKAFHKPEILLDRIFSKSIGKWFPDDVYLKIRFRLKMGYPLNLKAPRTFNEKLQWLKLNDRQPEYTKMVDKLAVKDYVATLLGEEYIIPTLGVWEKAEEIDFDSLPNQFVLKCNHDSATVTVVRDKSKLNREETIKKYNRFLKRNYYSRGREWPYKDVPRRVLAEKYIEPCPGENDLPDYKFFCFNGEVKLFKVDFDRFIEHHANYYDRKGLLLPFGETVCPPQYEKIIRIPESLHLMILAAEKIAQKMSFVRVDFYDHKDIFYFGEITFYPASGLGKFEPMEWDSKLGDMLFLPIN